MEVGKTYMKVNFQLNREEKLRDPGLIKLLFCFPMAAGIGCFLREYVRTHRIKELAQANGFTIKNHHTDVPAWPLRLAQNVIEKDFDWLSAARLMVGSSTSSSRELRKERS
jgi:hypothetical protein